MSYQSPFTCVPPKPSLFSRRPSAWASPYCVPKSVTLESTTECSYCVWSDYSPRQNLYNTPPELGAWLLLLKDTHSYFKNRMLGGRLWSSWLASGMKHPLYEWTEVRTLRVPLFLAYKWGLDEGRDPVLSVTLTYNLASVTKNRSEGNEKCWLPSSPGKILYPLIGS